MIKILAIAGLMSILASPAAASIGNSVFKKHAGISKSKPSCHSIIVNNKIITVEFQISCGTKSAIFIYSPLEKLFCDPQLRCRKSLSILTKNWFSKKQIGFK